MVLVGVVRRIFSRSYTTIIIRDGVIVIVIIISSTTASCCHTFPCGFLSVFDHVAVIIIIVCCCCIIILLVVVVVFIVVVVSFNSVSTRYGTLCQLVCEYLRSETESLV